MKRITQLLATVAIASSSALAGDFLKPVSNGENDFLEPFDHIHFTKAGSPIIHSFGVEPAFTGRDLFIDQTYRTGQDVTEHETEVELEWAFTRRLGVIVEVPYVYEDEEGVATTSGFGDLAIVPRVLLIDAPRFMLTTQMEIGLPTGSSSFGGETAIAPGIALWNDLGNWLTLNSNIAVEHNFDADVSELVYGFGLVKTFGEKPYDHDHDHSGHNHCSAGLFHIHLEVTGENPLNGAGKGDFYAEGLVGFSYGILSEMDIRIGYQFPITTPKDFDHGITGGVIYHF